tara:strand:- start:3494 stop:5257 length:1764 start_codon:yes stop_codon:yes gene_type:complete
MEAILDKNEAEMGARSSTGEMAMSIFYAGPATLDNIHVNGEQYAFAILPVEFFDSKEKIINTFLGNSGYSEDEIKTIRESMPGTDKDWAKIIGYHEGAHIDGKDIGDTLAEKLGEEVHSDRIAMARATEDGLGDVALALKDLRALSNPISDTVHATSGLLNTDDSVSSLHFEVARTYRQGMLSEVNEKFDFESYAGTARTARDLLRENPEAFFEAVHKGIDELKANALEEYNKDPSSYDARGHVVGTQIMADYINSFEGAHRRRALGQTDFPDNAPVQLIPQAVEDEYYVALKHENALEAIEDEDASAAMRNYSPNDAFENFDWDAYPGKAKSPVGYDDVGTDLQTEDPALFYNTQKEYLEDMRDDSILQYAADPSQENLENMLNAQHIIQKVALSLNRDLVYEMGEDAPQLSTEGFVPEDARRAYYENKLAEQEAQAAAAAAEAKEAAPAPDDHPAAQPPEDKQKPEPSHHEIRKGGADRFIDIDPSGAEQTTPATEADKGYEQGVDGTAYTTHVSGLDTGGEPDVDFENGVTIGGVSVGNFFAQSADPAPESVSVVNAMAPEPEVTSPSFIPPAVEVEQNVQALR